MSIIKVDYGEVGGGTAPSNFKILGRVRSNNYGVVVPVANLTNVNSITLTHFVWGSNTSTIVGLNDDDTYTQLTSTSSTASQIVTLDVSSYNRIGWITSGEAYIDSIVTN